MILLEPTAGNSKQDATECGYAGFIRLNLHFGSQSECSFSVELAYFSKFGHFSVKRAVLLRNAGLGVCFKTVNLRPV